MKSETILHRDLVKRLESLSEIMTETGWTVRAAECRMAAETIERLTRERDEAQSKLKWLESAVSKSELVSNDVVRSKEADIDAVKADRDAAIARAEAVASDVTQLREIISKCADALNNGAAISLDCSIGFMQSLPSEIGLHVASIVEDRDQWKERAEAAEHALELLADLHDAAGMPNCAARKKARSILAARITAATQTGDSDG